MEAKELMIGDIVLHHKTHELLSFKKLEKPIDEYIHIDGIIEEGVNEVYYQGDIDWIGYDEIEPIPLTEDILKANGFEDGGGYMTRVVSGRIVEICLMHNIPMYVKAEWSYCFPHPKYVHELQHALRLCGLNELADNFKIETDK